MKYIAAWLLKMYETIFNFISFQSPRHGEDLSEGEVDEEGNSPAHSGHHIEHHKVILIYHIVLYTAFRGY